MANNTLAITLIQPDIIWENAPENLARYEFLINRVSGQKEIVVLPEMFSTGFSMAPERLAESMSGPTVAWMKATAAANKIILTGSLIIEENGHYYNRLIWMQPDGKYYTYDKRHLFGYAGEDACYTAGDRKLIVQVKGWKICPLICYDLRFPVWSRAAVGAEYDVLLYTANWPQRRALAWNVLLQARAIENQSYVIGVNRVGEDGNRHVYSGGSSAFGPLGEPLVALDDAEEVQTILLEKQSLESVRTQLPFLKDGDSFLITG